MASSLRVNAIIPSSGTNVAIGTAGGTITYNANVSGVSTFSDGVIIGVGVSINSPSANTLKINAGIANSDAVTIGGGNFLYGVPSNAVYDTNGGANVGDYWFGQFGGPARGNSGTKVMVGASSTVSFVGFAHTNSSNVSVISSIIESRLSSNTAGSEIALLNILTKPSTSRTVTALSIDGAGRVTTPLQPIFQAYGNTSQTLNTTATPVKIQFTATEDIDNGGYFDAPNSNFNVPVTGKYLVYASIMLNSNFTTYTYLFMDFAKNDGRLGREIMVPRAGGGDFVSAQGSAIINASAGDTIQVYLVQSGGTAVGVRNDYRHFYGFLIG